MFCYSKLFLKISFKIFVKLQIHLTTSKMAKKVQEYKKSLEICLKDDTRAWTKLFNFAERTTGINRVYIFCGISGVLAIYLAFYIWAAQVVCNIIGLAYPAYMSIKALEDNPDKCNAVWKKWLTYWVFFAIYSVLELICVVISSIVPFYWLLKSGLLVWLMSNGSVLVNNKTIRPLFMKHQSTVDEFIASASDLMRLNNWNCWRKL